MKRARGRGKAGSVGMATSAKAWRKPFAGEDTRLLLRANGGWEGGGSWITLKSTSFKAAASRVRRSEGGLCGGLYSIDARPHLTELVAEHESLSLSLVLSMSEFLFLSRIGRCFF